MEELTSAVTGLILTGGLGEEPGASYESGITASEGYTRLVVMLGKDKEEGLDAGVACRWLDGSRKATSISCCFC